VNRTRTNLLRRAVMWTAGVVLAVSVAAWVAGRWPIYWQSRNGSGFALSYGRLFIWIDLNAVRNYDAWWSLRGEYRRTPWFHGPFVFGEIWRLKEGAIQLPLCMPATTAGIVLAGTWAWGRQASVRARCGYCASCGYDLTGLTGPCPECGKEREA